MTAAEDGVRLQKVLAEAGVGSRRASEELIAAGRVTVNDEVAVLGRRVHADLDIINIDGVRVPTKPGLVYYLINKPVQVVSTAHDPQGRPTVVDIVPSEPRVYPVGRLDWETEGLMILTNDGSLTLRLTHPRFSVEKEYLAEVDGVPTRSALRTLREGVELEDGVTAPAKVQLSQGRDDSAALTIVIHEGRNRQVRRMCDAVGHPVRRLIRMRIGQLADRTLKPGEYRLLTPAEVRGLYAATGTEPDPLDDDPLDPESIETGPTGLDAMANEPDADEVSQ